MYVIKGRYYILEEIMSEENMNNEPVNNTEQQVNGITNSVSNKPNKSNKKAIIIMSIIILLIVIAVVVIFIVRSSLTSEAALKLETSLNSFLSDMENDYKDSNKTISYKPFKCTGSSIIQCKSSSIDIKDSDLELISKDIVFSVEPGIKNTNLTFSGNLNVSLFDYNDERKGPIDINVDCKNNAEIDGDNEYIINNLVCTNKLQDITSKQTSKIYLKNEKFSIGNFILLIKDIEENKEFYNNILNETEYAVAETTNNLSSADLLQSILYLMNTFDKSEEYTKEKLVSQFEAAKSEFESLISIFGSSEEMPELQIIRNFIDVADNVLTKGHNKVDIHVKLKDGNTIDDVFFIGFEPRLYDVSLSSK